MDQRSGVRGIAAIGLAGLLAVALANPAGADDGGRRFVEHDLASDVPGRADITDPGLVNAWGMAQGPSTPAWVAANGTNQAEIYSGDLVVPPVEKLDLVVGIPTDGVTGQVFNETAFSRSPEFVVTDHHGHRGAALFIFDSEGGDILGWSPAVPPPAFSTTAQPAAHVDDANFKGLAMARSGRSFFLYAADFHRGRIVVFDDDFKRVHLGGSFTDPNMPKGYGPFNIAAIGDKLYVAYAKQDADRADEIAGAGLGFVDVFDTAGHFERQLISRGALNAPWGMTLAPNGFGDVGGALLVGNFGDGRIHAYNPQTGQLITTLRRRNGHPVEIDGLWALMFGNGASASKNQLLFSAGPKEESHGLFGTLTAAD
jgi:uncharacterized protein (TIGR03118 family)